MKIEVATTRVDGVLVISHEVFEDDRGFFMEVYRRDVFEQAGLPTEFVQFNHSRSAENVVRGLHFQWDPPMGKMMRVTGGRAFLVAVDIRKGSPTLGEWFGIELSESDRRQVWAPAGFARGFCTLTEGSEIQYLCTGTYDPTCESGIRWNDPELGITWPVENPSLSDKDQNTQTLQEWLDRPESEKFVYGG